MSKVTIARCRDSYGKEVVEEKWELPRGFVLRVWAGKRVVHVYDWAPHKEWWVQWNVSGLRGMLQTTRTHPNFLTGDEAAVFGRELAHSLARELEDK